MIYILEVCLGVCCFPLMVDFLPQVTEITNCALIFDCGYSFWRSLLRTKLGKIVQSSFSFSSAKDTRGVDGPETSLYVDFSACGSHTSQEV